MSKGSQIVETSNHEGRLPLSVLTPDDRLIQMYSSLNSHLLLCFCSWALTTLYGVSGNSGTFN